MNECVVVYRDPREIAAEINAIKRSTATYILSQSIEIGRLLCEAKETVGHGEWGNWLAENCDYSTTNANNLMRIYQEYGEQDQMDFFQENRLELFGNLTRSQAVALLALPKHERAAFVAEHDPETMSTREFEKAVAEAKEQIRKEAEERLAAELQENDAVYAGEIQRIRERAQADVEKAMEETREAEERAKAARKEADKTLVDALKSKDEAQVNLEKALKREKELTDQAEKEKERAQAREREVRALREELKKLEEEREEAEQLAVPDPSEVEKAVAEAVEKEVAAEREKTAALEAENAKLRKAADPTVQKFTGLFEAWQEDWNRMQKVLAECEDSQTSEKLSAALRKMLEIMRGQMRKE